MRPDHYAGDDGFTTAQYRTRITACQCRTPQRDTADIGARLCRTNPDHDGYGDCDDDCDIEILHGLAIAVVTAVEWLHPDGRRSTQTITADGQSFTADVGLTYLTLQALTR